MIRRLKRKKTPLFPFLSFARRSFSSCLLDFFLSPGVTNTPFLLSRNDTEFRILRTRCPSLNATRTLFGYSKKDRIESITSFPCSAPVSRGPDYLLRIAPDLATCARAARVPPDTIGRHPARWNVDLTPRCPFNSFTLFPEGHA